jgi:hypothetical protein
MRWLTDLSVTLSMYSKTRSLLLAVEFIACYWHLLAVLPLGFAWGLISLVQGGYLLLLGLILPGTLGLMGIVSMLMELISGDVQLPRFTQIFLTGIGVLLLLLLFAQFADRDNLLYALYFFGAPILCAVHFIALTRSGVVLKAQPEITE